MAPSLLGLENIVTVVMDDAVLVADASRMQDVRNAVDHLEQLVSRKPTNMPKITGHGDGLKVW